MRKSVEISFDMPRIVKQRFKYSDEELIKYKTNKVLRVTDEDLVKYKTKKRGKNPEILKMMKNV